MKTMPRFTLALAVLACGAVLATAGLAARHQDVTPMPTLAELQKMTARFAPADIGADLSALPKNERDALARLIDAARIMDALFLRQVWAGNDAMLQDLAARAAKPVGPRASRSAAARLRYFLINKGPWDRLDHNRPFVPGAPAEARGGQLLSRRGDEGGGPEVVRRPLGSREGGRHRVLHDHPPRRQGVRRRAL